MFTRMMTILAALVVVLAVTGCSSMPSAESGLATAETSMPTHSDATVAGFQGYEDSVDCFFDSNRTERECAAR